MLNQQLSARKHWDGIGIDLLNSENLPSRGVLRV